MTEATRPVTIRSATQDDKAAVATMVGEFHAWLAALDGSDPCFDAEATAAKLVRCGFGQRPLFSALVAEAKGEAGGEAVGCALYNIGFWADSLQGMVLLSDLTSAGPGVRAASAKRSWTGWPRSGGGVARWSYGPAGRDREGGLRDSPLDRLDQERGGQTVL